LGSSSVLDVTGDRTEDTSSRRTASVAGDTSSVALSATVISRIHASMVELLAQVAAYRDLSSSLAVDEP